MNDMQETVGEMAERKEEKTKRKEEKSIFHLHIYVRTQLPTRKRVVTINPVKIRNLIIILNTPPSTQPIPTYKSSNFYH